MRDVIRGAITGAEPASLTEAKLQFRQDQATDDTLIPTLISAVRVAAEQYTRRALVRGAIVYAVRGEDKPCLTGGIVLPWVPVISLTSLEYIQYSTGSTVALTLSDFTLHAYDDHAFVAPKPGLAWPTDVYELRIAYTCGYQATDIPAAIKLAVMVEVAKQYRDREGPDAKDLDHSPAFYALLSPWRVGWFG
jgi:uncharacterized phiE125 gp8 family phage protein